MFRHKIICIFAALLILLSLSSCFLYDKAVGNNISPFIDPLNNDNDSFLPDSHAEKVIVLDIDDDHEVMITPDIVEDEDDGIIVLDENSIRQTKPPIIEINEDGKLNYYYEGETFLIQIPFLWRTTMEVDILFETDADDTITYYTFYYLPANQPFDPPERAQVITLRVVPYFYYLKYGHGKDGYAATGSVSSTDKFVYTYYAPDENQKLSSDFPNLEDYSTIIKVLTNNWNFKLKADG